jgi:hypothetical protein
MLMFVTLHLRVGTNDIQLRIPKQVGDGCMGKRYDGKNKQWSPHYVFILKIYDVN